METEICFKEFEIKETSAEDKQASKRRKKITAT